MKRTCFLPALIRLHILNSEQPHTQAVNSTEDIQTAGWLERSCEWRLILGRSANINAFLFKICEKSDLYMFPVSESLLYINAIAGQHTLEPGKAAVALSSNTVFVRSFPRPPSLSSFNVVDTGSPSRLVLTSWTLRAPILRCLMLSSTAAELTLNSSEIAIVLVKLLEYGPVGPPE